MKIRKIKNENVRNFLLQCWIDTYVGIEGITEHDIRKFFSNSSKKTIPKNFKQYGAFVGDKIVGYIYFYTEQNKTILKSIYVSKNQQRKGIGSKLLNKLGRNLPVYLSVVKSNKNARKFYRKNGFKLSNKKTLPFVINGKKIEEVIYYWPRENTNISERILAIKNSKEDD